MVLLLQFYAGIILIAVDLIHLIATLSRSGYMLSYVFMSNLSIFIVDISSITLEVSNMRKTSSGDPVDHRCIQLGSLLQRV